MTAYIVIIAALMVVCFVLHARLKRVESRLSDIDDSYRTVMDEKCASDEKHCTCVPFLRRRIKELEELEEVVLQFDGISICRFGTSGGNHDKAWDAVKRLPHLAAKIREGR